MLKIKLRKRRVVLGSILAVAMLLTGTTVGALQYYTNQSIAKSEKASKEQNDKIDAQIKVAKTKREAEWKAKEAAERKAAEDAAQKAEAEAALGAQQQGKVVQIASCALSGAHGNPNAIDVVVNKKHCFSPIDFSPGDLVTIHGATISAKAQADFEAMFAAAAADGQPFGVTSSFRSYGSQVSTYNYWVNTSGGTAAADKFSARPGYSEHQTGLAMDVSAGNCVLDCFVNTSQYKWMQANANTYGWIERYQPGFENITGYSPEAWHYRYVGVATAQAMKAKGVKTLEQFWNISGGSY